MMECGQPGNGRHRTGGGQRLWSLPHPRELTVFTFFPFRCFEITLFLYLNKTSSEDIPLGFIPTLITQAACRTSTSIHHGTAG